MTRVSGGHSKSGGGKVIKMGWGKPKTNAGKSYTVSTLSREQKSNLKKASHATSSHGRSRKSLGVAYSKLRSSYGLGSSQKNAGKSR
tara:strand:+ start:3334 stop:3594 length:261 start_codon:yes stop_codon:yes gene_type:complete